MRIEIEYKARPFFHTPGTEIILPGSVYSLSIYPTRIVVKEICKENQDPIVLNNNLVGPIENFTVQQDLERSRIIVWGISQQGYFRYFIHASKEGKGFALMTHKQTQNGLTWASSSPLNTSNDGKTILVDTSEKELNAFYAHSNLETLHLGVNKKLDWNLVLQRECLDEILPIWFALGQQVPFSSAKQSETIYTQCDECIESNNKQEVVSLLRQLFKIGFRGMLRPQLQDTLHLGHPLQPMVAESPLALLSEGATLIRSLFVRQKDLTVDILPCLPPEFHCGRMINIHLENIGILNIEWTKKTIRRVTLEATDDTEATFQFDKHLSKFRLREKRSKQVCIISCGSAIRLQAGCTYYIDNFKK